MILEIRVPDSFNLQLETLSEYRAFLQMMANRLAVGAVRSGEPPNRSRKYLTRLTKELQAYKRTGNAEGLMNIANYAFLESAAPEHKKQVWDATRKSVTRGEKEN